ncbi:alpha/beta hydrolase [Leeuwenhoekiella polynyae]|uniref:S-formylglutathione hydrolase FrmB n=3 Tax=Leeuwenhoekiella TaxID=283735 RepID=A0A4Q0PEX2_9FLAO|nr:MULTISPECIES: alpha/beta hydrolase family protein [Leeuwenhoekiella]RXG25425.1 S-formylglutathione hydrolase FrmB [Leeuwenhoekiella marinoflava]RXG25553.1 S-formylglutathione hydrolase FrmB [Leeuwenhoekiella polynyae]SHF88737.1 S-formylglutathione hydrolase FrmB [Leeuwenhoekiella marinoflava DSM 3653]
MRLLGIYFLALSFSISAYAGKIQTVTTHSDAMQKDIHAIVITPEGYSTSKEYPVVYLLHGYSGNYTEWSKQVPDLDDYADLYQLIIVCPDGNYGSWYFDSEVKPESKYDTYVAKELVHWVDQHFSTINDKSGRAITGLSMGGHGALYLAFKHQDIYALAGSMSGGVDITPFPNNWELASYLGSYAEHKERWEANTVINLTNLLTPDSLKLIIECGTSDFFYKVNVNLHEKLEYTNIPHTFISSPGGHTWDFWRNAIKYQLVFFNSYFEK